MSEAIGQTFILDGTEYAVEEFPSVESRLNNDPFIYEVIRVEEGVPLFLQDYLERLRNSYRMMEKSMSLPESEIVNLIKRLLQSNKSTHIPVKLVFGLGSKPFVLAFLMQAHLPLEAEYLSGVSTVWMHETRNNPNLKVWNQGLRKRSVELLNKAGAYEAILLNSDNCITEASRSNVFFIQGNTVFTTPVDLVLPGITRKKILEVCALRGVEVKFRKIQAEDVGAYDSCFLTGTARKIVPVRTIGEVAFNTNTPMLQKISGYFEDYVQQYIEQHR